VNLCLYVKELHKQQNSITLINTDNTVYSRSGIGYNMTS